MFPLLDDLHAAGAKRFMRHWAERAEAVLNDIARAEPEQSMHLSRTLDDRLEVRAGLTGLNAAYVEAAIRLASCDDPDLSPAERRADAFGVVAKFFLDNQHGRTGGRHRPHVNVVIDAGRASLIDGTVLSTSDAAQIGCDAAFHRVLLDAPSTALDVGRATRNISASLFTMLSLRDGGCRFPGCDRPASMTEAHHVRWWEHGGETAPDNPALLCSRHHHKVHLPGWAMKLLPDGEVHVTKPDGTEVTSYPGASREGVQPRPSSGGTPGGSAG